MALVDGLSHLLVQVTDLDRSEAFYRDVFGLDVVGRDLVAEEGPNSLLKTNNGHFVLLVQVDKVQPFRPNSSSIHHAFYLTAEQHYAARERRRAQGFEVDDTRAAFRANGQYSFDVFDPDGHRYQVQGVGPEASVVMKADKGNVVCGKADDFAVGSVTHFKDAQFYLVRHAGGFLALSHWCTHMNGELRWRPEHWSFYCPFHKATFNRKGESTSHHKGYPALRIHPVSIAEDGTVSVDTNELINRRGFDPSQLAPCAAAPCGATAGAAVVSGS
jgi:catechol 2,3-dioxygenase-like lactoylglutathione lyase family enzyme/nitrite reductase/ring-hydroxylating ferredoxin subunit